MTGSSITRAKRALLDSNFLMVPGQFKVDIFSELDDLGYKPVVLSCIVSEVRHIAKGKGKPAAHARIALELMKAKNLEIVEAEGNADEVMLGYALENKCAIATNDVALIRRAKKFGVPVLRLRQRKYIIEE